MTFGTFGIIGYGHFGQLLATSLAEHGRVRVYDTDPAKLTELPDGVEAATFSDVAQSDVVALAVPFGALEEVLAQLRGHLAPDTVVMDVVSTKQLATQLLTSALGGHQEILATHPLFGPPSMERITPGLRLVVTHAGGERAEALAAFLEHDLGLEILRIAPEEHDRAMAYMQALPFFIARALVQLDILRFRDSELALPSFEKLATIAAIEEHHTHGMFDTSQRSNPYADQVRADFMRILAELDAEILQSEREDPLPTAT
jgi:prephenate dehydrogenase